MGVGAVGTMAPYIAQYLLERPDVVGLLPACYVIAAVVSIPIWVRVSKSFGKRDTWLASMVLAAGAFGGMWFVGTGDVALAMVLLGVAGCAMGCIFCATGQMGFERNLNAGEVVAQVL